MEDTLIFSSCSSDSRPCDSSPALASTLSTTRGSWCTNLYGVTLVPSVLYPQSLSTILPATPFPTQTLQSMIQMRSPFASRYPLLMFLILGLGPRLLACPPRPLKFGSSSSTNTFTSNLGKSASRRCRMGYAGSSVDGTQK